MCVLSLMFVSGEYGGRSSVAERLTVAQEVAGSIPVAHPIPANQALAWRYFFTVLPISSTASPTLRRAVPYASWTLPAA